jgi:hypothetical protein
MAPERVRLKLIDYSLIVRAARDLGFANQAFEFDRIRVQSAGGENLQMDSVAARA